MTIMRDGVDVTDEIMTGAKRNGKRQRQIEMRVGGHWFSAIVYLIKAKAALYDTPAPWCDDCIYDSIEKIDAIIADLKGEK
jgi:hypothetical protein